MTTQPYDVVVFGATSFVGQILSRYLFEAFGLDGPLRWAAAGRSPPKLEEVRKSFGRGAGYGSTAKMFGQAAACLANDISKKDVAGGFWTPAAIFGDRIVERLQAHSGLTFEVLDQ